VKLVVATSVVVAAAVGSVTVFAQRAMTAITDTQIRDRREVGEAAIVRESVLVLRSVANGVAVSIANHAYDDVEPVLSAAIAQDRSGTHGRVRWLIVEDEAGTVVQQTPGAPPPTVIGRYAQALHASIPGDGVGRASIGDTEWVYGQDLIYGSTMVGKLRMGVSTADLDHALQTSLAASEDLAHAARNRALLASFVVLAIGISLAAFHGARLARPIKQLTAQAERIAGGDLVSRVSEGRRDELGVLAHTFNVMSDQIRRLLVEQTAKAALEKELSLARQVQHAMLPPDTLEHHGALSVVGYCMPATSCGGDWWSYRKLSDSRMLLVIGDATGHGIHSAMIAATARGAVEGLSTIDERLISPEQVLRAIDAAIRQLGDHNVMMTAFAAVVDAPGPARGTLHYANAGHNFPYVMTLGATRVLAEAHILAAAGNPLGDRQIAVEIRCGTRDLEPGDLLVCFTDGLVERANPAGVLYGDRRLRAALAGAPLADGAALVTLRDRIVRDVERHANGAIAEDDITLVLCQFDPSLAVAVEPGARRGAA